MESKIILPFILILAISMQCILSLKQGKALGNTFSDMKRKGNVLVGKYKHHFRGGAYIFFNIDDDGSIEDAKIITGRTIFSNIKRLPDCIGKNIYTLSFDKYCIQKAYEDSICHYQEACFSSSNVPNELINRSN